VDFNQRARRFMFNIISETPVMPRSLTITGVSMPAERNYIGNGGYGRVYKGDLHGAVVALKVLYKSDSNTVCPSCHAYNVNSDFCFSGLLSRGADVGYVVLSEAQIYAPILRNLYIRVNVAIVPCLRNAGSLWQWQGRTNPSIAGIQKRVWFLLLRLLVHTHSRQDTGSRSRSRIHTFGRYRSWRYLRGAFLKQWLFLKF